MELLLQRADIQEDEEDNLSRFVAGLNRNIADPLILHDYSNLERALHKAITIRNRLFQRNKAHSYYPYDKGTPYNSSIPNSPQPLSTPSRTTSIEEPIKTQEIRSKGKTSRVA
ncbi:hypothetical protein HRI_002261900 [Hibiscus trionum]|uniref:Uncharacterized protein n=1 Tax=Hibiscus trionum TaxID=183268 RepID=A0A9W7M371_HIBTR|nr:hypothetical protein HRI_002261900 [Hibiscus trionum]